LLLLTALLTPAALLLPLQMKNTSTDMLEGKVGRIYMPKQQVDTMALHKMKGLKRERRQAAAATSEAKKAKRAKPAAAAEEEAG
jgi:ribosome production factor 2